MGYEHGFLHHPLSVSKARDMGNGQRLSGAYLNDTRVRKRASRVGEAMSKRGENSVGLVACVRMPVSSCHGFVVGDRRGGGRMAPVGDGGKSTLSKEGVDVVKLLGRWN